MARTHSGRLVSELKVGDDVEVFDSSLFVNDKVTPPDVTYKRARILKIYEGAPGDVLGDVEFEYNGKVSKGHFLNMIR